MSRLAPPGWVDEWTIDDADAMVQIYEILRDKPLAEVTRICREAAR
ncbi:MAG: hypothetical protein ACRDUW_18245 [Pseudonocardiaceae bacterium]